MIESHPTIIAVWKFLFSVTPRSIGAYSRSINCFATWGIAGQAKKFGTRVYIAKIVQG
jgi:hypothetical protein